MSSTVIELQLHSHSVCQH